MRPSRWSVRTVLSTTVAVLTVVAAGCGGSGGARDATAPTTTTPTTTTLGSGDGTFTMRTETFVDPSRPTGATPGRTLPTDIYVPGGTGPFPLILHNHGLAGSSAKFTELLGAWATAGYVVVAPNFPLTNASLPQAQRNISDVANQPADATFVLDQVLAETAPGGKLAGKVSTGHMGVSGLSLGGATTYGLLFHPCCRDERFRSAVLMSAFELSLGSGDFDWARRLPVLVFAGTADLAVPYARQQTVIAKLAGPTWSVTLDGGQHALPFENDASPHDAVVTATSLDFWAATLRDDAAAKARIATDATVPGLSSVTVTP